MSSRFKLLPLITLFLLFFSFGKAQAHDVFSGEANVAFVDNSRIQLQLNMAAVTAEVFLQDIVGRDNQLSEQNLVNIQGHMRQKALKFFLLQHNQQSYQLTDFAMQIISAEDAVVLTLTYQLPNKFAETESLQGQFHFVSPFIKHTNPEYKLTVSVKDQKQNQLALWILDNQNLSHSLDLAAAAEKFSPVNLFKQFFVLGVEHILIGYDHILFLFALLIICRTWQQAAVIITCFTIAHSITLSLAALGYIEFSAKWIEAIIALSIVYVAIENLLKKHQVQHRWALTVCFGLVHGLGFANVLMDLGLADAANAIFVPLAAFNLGVEVGQLFIACLVLPVLWYCNRYPWYQHRALPVCSAAILLVGGYWMVERLI